ncbi:MAG: hypothetical protein NTY81_00915 [Candidatus Staskawiczbacteria bacterium]|nr:hypothetical protein [Candidatus Staskawiczbacteria bacterium]
MSIENPGFEKDSEPKQVGEESDADRQRRWDELLKQDDERRARLSPKDLAKENRKGRSKTLGELSEVELARHYAEMGEQTRRFNEKRRKNMSPEQLAEDNRIHKITEEILRQGSREGWVPDEQSTKEDLKRLAEKLAYEADNDRGRKTFEIIKHLDNPGKED